MSATGRKRKQLLRPRQDLHRSPTKRQSLDVKEEQQLSSVYPLADYDCVDIKPDLTELQLQLAVTKEKDATVSATPAASPPIEATSGQEQQQSDSDEDGYSEIDLGVDDVFSQDEVDDYDPEWTSHQTAPRLKFKFETALHKVGLNTERRSLSPVFCFNQLLGQRTEFFAQLASSCNERSPTLKANAEELEIFVGLCLLISDVKLAQLGDYWTEHMFFGFVGFAKKMSQQRFLELLQSLNFQKLNGSANEAATANAAGDAGGLINFFNARMALLYVCGQQLVLNEPIIQWKHKFSYQNELPDKFRNNAIMLHLLTEPSGLIIRIVPEILVEKIKRNSRQLVEQRNALAMQLLQDQQQKGHSLYVCKYYGSYGLAFELAKQGIYCSGLLDRNRYGNSKALVHEHLAPQSIATRYASPLMMAKWRRREKCVYFYSSDCLAIYAKELSRQKNNARPKLIQELEFQLRPTQSSRLQLLSYQPNCSGMQGQQELAIYLLNMFVFNAHQIYLANAHRTWMFSRCENPQLKNYAEFRLTLIRSLLKMDVEEAASSGTDATVSTANNIKEQANVSGEGNLAEPKHELIAIQHNGKSARKNCRHCGKCGLLQYTKFMCKQCPNTPGLCPDPCFKLWHEQLKQQKKTKNYKSN